MDINIGNSSTKTFTITNTGGADLEVSAISSDDGQFVISNLSTPLSAVLAGNETLTFDVIFTPASSGAQSANISIVNTDADENPYTFVVSGSGIDACGDGSYTHNAVQSSYNWADQSFVACADGTLTEACIYVQNSGHQFHYIVVWEHDDPYSTSPYTTPEVGNTYGISQDDITETQISPGVYKICFDPSAFSIPLNEGQGYAIRWACTGNAGFLYDDTNPYCGGMATSPYQGADADYAFSYSINGGTTTNSPPEIEVDDLMVGTDFGGVVVGGSNTKNYEISNTGDNDLSISAITVGGDFSIQNISQTLPFDIIAGESLTFDVLYQPTAQGSDNEVISISSNDCNEDPYTFAIQGTAFPAASAMDFEGNWDGANASNGSTLSLSGGSTIEFWFKPEADATLFPLLKNSGYGFMWQGTTSGMRFYRGGGWASGETNKTDWNLDQWYHIAWANGKVYIDGVLDGFNTGGTYGSGHHPFAIGSYSTGMNGDMDEVRIWSDERTCEEINTYMNCELNGDEANLIAYYDFNQGGIGMDNSSITQLLDRGPNGYHLDFVDMSLTGTEENFIESPVVSIGAECGEPELPEINLIGDGQPIVDNSPTVNVNNGTDFGSVLVLDGEFAEHTFTIENTGLAELLLGVDAVSITGSHAEDFTVTLQPSESVAASSSTSFMVKFIPGATGTRYASISIDNNDCNENPYNFAIQGYGQPPIPAAALDFDGVNDEISVPFNAAFPVGSEPRTIEAWVKIPADNTDHLIVAGWGPDMPAQTSHLAIYNDSRFGLWMHGADHWSTSTIPADTWTHIAVSYDGTTSKLYFNGNLESSKSITLNTGVTNINIGKKYSWIERFYGQMDEVRIWNTALCDDQILNNINCELENPGSIPGLVAYYDFNQGYSGTTNSSENTLIDRTGNGHDGSLSNFELDGTSSNWVEEGAVSTGTLCLPWTDEAPQMTCPSALNAICSVSEHPAYVTLADFEAAGGSVTDACGIDENSFILLSEVSDNGSNPETVTSTVVIPAGKTPKERTKFPI